MKDKVRGQTHVYVTLNVSMYSVGRKEQDSSKYDKHSSLKNESLINIQVFGDSV